MSSISFGTVVAFLTVVSCGLIAGQMLAIAIGNYAALSLSEETWTLRFQTENTVFTKTMPAALLTPIIGLAALGIIELGQARWLFVTACVLNLAVLGITIAVNVPINNEVQSWRAGSAPMTWPETRNRWLRFHLARTILGLASFAVSVAAPSFGAFIR